jgi:hypothetical protein
MIYDVIYIIIYIDRYYDIDMYYIRIYTPSAIFSIKCGSGHPEISRFYKAISLYKVQIWQP